MAHDLTKASVALCIGKDCRRRAEFDDLHSLLTGLPHIETKCLDVCKGPVVVVSPHSDDEIVLAMIRSRKERRDLRRSIVSGRAGFGKVLLFVFDGSPKMEKVIWWFELMIHSLLSA